VKRSPVESSSIASVGYDRATSTLEVEFISGETYAYHDVPEDIYHRLIIAESKGRFVNYEIKPNYAFTKRT
jgi:hypothetical protein